MKNKINHLQANELTPDSKSSMRTRIIAGAIGIIPCLICLYLGDYFFLALITAFLAICVYELLGVCGHRNVPIYIVYFIFLLAVVYWPIFQGLLDKAPQSWHLYYFFRNLHLPLIVLTCGIFLSFLLVVLYDDFTVRDACFLTTMGLIVGLGLQALLFLRYLPLYPLDDGLIIHTDINITYQSTFGSSQLLMFVLIGTMVTDIGAYFVGIFFGKNKINERISPKKTWEGFFGGLVIAGALAMAFGFIMAGTGNPIAKYFDLAHWYNIVILSLIMPIVATLGDFVFSSVKRYYNVKDFGNLIPGHGGALDRLDSILFAALIAAVYINIVTNAFEGSINPLI